MAFNPSSTTVLTAVVAVEAFIIIVLLFVIWQLVEKVYQINLRIENLVPISFMKQVSDEIANAVQRYTDASPTPRDDWADDAIRKVLNYGIGALENRQRMEKVVLEIPEDTGGLG